MILLATLRGCFGSSQHVVVNVLHHFLANLHRDSAYRPILCGIAAALLWAGRCTAFILCFCRFRCRRSFFVRYGCALLGGGRSLVCLAGMWIQPWLACLPWLGRRLFAIFFQLGPGGVWCVRIHRERCTCSSRPTLHCAQAC